MTVELPGALRRALRERLGLTVPVQQVAVRQRRHTMLRLVGTERGRMWIKTYRRDRDDARREYEFLRLAYEALRGVPGLGVPEPIAYLEPGSVVLSDVEGRPLRELLAEGPVAAAERAVRRCGEWLATVHAAGELGRDEFDLRLAAAFVDDGWPGLGDRLEHLVAAATSWDRVAVVTHGDFAPHNVLVEEDRVVVLDPSFHDEFGRHDGRCSRHEDVARFWAAVRGVAPDDRASARRRALADAFLDAYANGRDVRTPAFVLFAVLQQGIALRDWSGLPQPVQNALLSDWLNELERSG